MTTKLIVQNKIPINQCQTLHNRSQTTQHERNSEINYYVTTMFSFYSIPIEIISIVNRVLHTSLRARTANT